MRIDPRRLLDFLAVARHGSFSAAADALNVSQPGLSQSIAQLEHGLGDVRLLERDRHGARLTPLGEALAFHARAIDAQLNRAGEDMRLRMAGLAGELRVGVTPVSAAQLVPQAVTALLQVAPEVGVVLIEQLDQDLLSMLQAHELDLVVCRLRSVPASGLAHEALSSADWSVVVSPSHPLAQRASVSMQELAQERWVLPASGSAFRDQMELVFGAAGLPWPAVSISSNSVAAIKAMVMASDCMTVMAPALVAVEREAGRLCTVPISDVTAMQPVGMIWRDNDETSPITLRFMQILRETAAQHPTLQA